MNKVCHPIDLDGKRRRRFRLRKLKKQRFMEQERKEINEPSRHVRSSAHRKRIDHPGLKISATPAIEKYLDHPGLGSSAAQQSRNV
ncbi:hypothetical protein TNIN_282261 [Trichonephila inaurata madagascariensis]|uniref:Uncharacterized protein n=1 Tax=Trichonephila inaurata madagascariensis TaxID=2747483 RepID=A0A8X7BU40_9ARAC|nr:hypothetical protein TNIN_282261 [Trichonephila inaurata madagascariensis]